MKKSECLVHKKKSLLMPPNGSSKKGQIVNIYKLSLPTTPRHTSFYLPGDLMEELENMEFAIPNDVHTKVSYLLANADFHLINPVYSGTKELKSIGYKFIEEAISLLCDYIYDKKTQYYFREDNSKLSKKAIKSIVMYVLLQGEVKREDQLMLSKVHQADEELFIKIKVHENDQLKNSVSDAFNHYIMIGEELPRSVRKQALRDKERAEMFSKKNQPIQFTVQINLWTSDEDMKYGGSMTYVVLSNSAIEANMIAKKHLVNRLEKIYEGTSRVPKFDFMFDTKVTTHNLESADDNPIVDFSGSLPVITLERKA